MPELARSLVAQINEAVGGLIKTGLSDDQNHAFLRRGVDGACDVTFTGAGYVSTGMRDVDYQDIYDDLKRYRAYTVRMADGALLQLMYRCEDEELLKHRLAFWPSPYLEDFQNEPEIYVADEIYAEVLKRGVVPFPIRFDFDVSEELFEELVHPKSHVTLGQYSRCRIPVSAPLTPARFFEFVLRNFYHTAHRSFCDYIPLSKEGKFDETISEAEKEVIYLSVPGTSAA